jgi:hypothetical protein
MLLQFALAQDYITGFVRDSITQEPIINAIIYKTKQSATISDSRGQFQLYLNPADSIHIQKMGWKSKHLTAIKNNTVIYLSEEIFLADEVIVEFNYPELIKQQNGVNIIETSKIENYPMIGAESDLIKVVQSKNGVTNGKDFSNGFYVRGGKADQNLILLDGVKVYNPNHLFGFFSVFNTNSIKSVELYKSTFPVEHAGALSSLTNVQLKDGNRTSYHYGLAWSLLTSKLFVEGPISTDMSFYFSFRRSYYDVLLNAFKTEENTGEELESDKNAFLMDDLTLKLNYFYGTANKLSYNFFLGRDNISAYDPRINEYALRLYWKNITMQLNLEHFFSSKSLLSAKLYSIYYESDYRNKLLEESQKKKQVLNDVGFKFSWDYYTKETNYKLGFDLRLNDAEAVIERPAMLNDFSKLYSEKRVFASINHSLNNQLSAGAAINSTKNSNFDKLYHDASVHTTYQLSESEKMKGSIALNHQFIFALSSSQLDDATSFYYPVREGLDPQTSLIYALSHEKIISEYFLQSEIYYKSIDHMYYLKSHDYDFNRLSNFIDNGNGYSYGFDINIEKRSGATKGWLSLSMQYTRYQYRELNKAREFEPKFSKPIQANLFLDHRLSDSWHFSLSAFLSSGFLLTVPESSYPIFGSKIYEYDKINNYRTDFNRRIDLNFTYNFALFHGKAKLHLNLYNAFASPNPLTVYFDPSKNQMVFLSAGFIPTFGLSYEY